jgi:hypothetical protein
MEVEHSCQLQVFGFEIEESVFLHLSRSALVPSKASIRTYFLLNDLRIWQSSMIY